MLHQWILPTTFWLSISWEPCKLYTCHSTSCPQKVFDYISSTLKVFHFLIGLNQRLRCWMQRALFQRRWGLGICIWKRILAFVRVSFGILAAFFVPAAVGVVFGLCFVYVASVCVCVNNSLAGSWSAHFSDAFHPSLPTSLRLHTKTCVIVPIAEHSSQRPLYAHSCWWKKWWLVYCGLIAFATVPWYHCLLFVLNETGPGIGYTEQVFVFWVSESGVNSCYVPLVYLSSRIDS